MTDSEAEMDMAERYLLLRRLEARLRQNDKPTTRELAEEFHVPRRSMCRYICVLETAEEFGLPLVQDGWRWEVLR